MTFITAFVRTIQAAWTGTSQLAFGIGDAAKKPYVVILVVPPNNETPDVLCRAQGEGGEVTLQFSCAADSTQQAVSELEALKAIVRAIRGLITVDATSYRISENRCTGVADFDASLGTWSAIFEATVKWEDA